MPEDPAPPIIDAPADAVPPTDAPTDARAQLAAHFAAPIAAHPERWSQLWDTGFLPWDRGAPNPALEDLLSERRDLLGGDAVVVDDGEWKRGEEEANQGGERGNEGEERAAAVGTKGPRRKRALIPGCGRGYDVLLFASFGYDAVGLDVSDTAVRLCREFAAEHEGEYPLRGDAAAVAGTEQGGKGVGRGEARFVKGDFFSTEWEAEFGGGEFDLIYDNTFLSALPPSLRPAWSARYHALLTHRPWARLICLEFPTYKPASTGGPPWGLPPSVYVAHLTRPGEEVSVSSEGDGGVVSAAAEERHEEDEKKEQKQEQKQEDGDLEREVWHLTRLAHFQPPRTHDIGRGTDWVGIWAWAWA
ncbi:MAG: hypothetical protein M1819_004753 [Sarea resinae]|nr:MAG: hypothetical protein M1819_004753 [Sarea resinae]